MNDPTTAIQAVDQLHDLLHRLAVRRLPPLRRTTSDGRLTVVVPTPDFENYLVRIPAVFAPVPTNKERPSRVTRRPIADTPVRQTMP